MLRGKNPRLVEVSREVIMQNLIFLHGFPFNSSMWQPQLRAFEGKHNVFAPNLRGHLDGPKGLGPWMMEHFVEDIKLFIDQNNLEKVVLCGLSMGGYVALNFAQKYQEFLAGLVLCDTQAAADINEAKDKRYALVLRIHKEGLGEFAREFSKNVLSETTILEYPEIQKNITAMIMKNNPADIAMVAGALASRRDCTPYLNRISCPTLVIVGSEDKVTSVEANLQLSKGIKNSDFIIIERAGHLSNLEQPEIFNRYLDEFISQKIVL